MRAKYPRSIVERAELQHCTFTYPGPLRPESMDCFSGFFTSSIPFKEPSLGDACRSFTLRGVSWEGGPPPVPIIITFKDRVSVLLEILRTYWRSIKTPYEIVILNDNSTYLGALAFLDRLRDAGVKVYDNDRAWSGFDELYKINAALLNPSWLSTHQTITS